MFERFTKEARAAVVDAQTVAREAHSTQIDTRHVVVALLRTGGPASDAVRAAGVDPTVVARRAQAAVDQADVLDAEALATLGIDLDAVRARTDEVFGRGALENAARPRRSGPKGHIPFTGDAKKALELALREAIRLKDRSIEQRHLLLGILRADSPGGRVLAKAAADAGVDVPTLRAAVERGRDVAA